MKKSNSNCMILVMIVSLAFCAVMLTFEFMIADDCNQKENTTTEFSATVKQVVIGNTEDKQGVRIYTQEYDAFLYIPLSVDQTPNVSGIKKLETGETIYFRINNDFAKQMENSSLFPIRSLRTEKSNIISLDDYNNSYKKIAMPRMILIGIIALAAFVVSMYCLFSAIRRRKEISRENFAAAQRLALQPAAYSADEEVLFENRYVRNRALLKEMYFHCYFKRKWLMAIYIILALLFVISLITAIVNMTDHTINLSAFGFVPLFFIAMYIFYINRVNTALNSDREIYGSEPTITIIATDEFIKIETPGKSSVKLEYGKIKRKI